MWSQASISVRDLGKLPPFPDPQFPHLYMEATVSTSHSGEK